MEIYRLNNWAMEAAMIMQLNIEKTLHKKGACSVLLTGGKSGSRLYKAWSLLPGFKALSGVNFYLGDERCVHHSDPMSNFGMIMRDLFDGIIQPGCNLIGPQVDSKKIEDLISNYESKLPKFFDLAIFGIGDDGHFASLFPFSSALNERTRRVAYITAPIYPYSRITITPALILSSNSIYALAPGLEKGAILKKLLKDESDEDASAIPAKLLNMANWLVEKKYS